MNRVYNSLLISFALVTLLSIGSVGCTPQSKTASLTQPGGYSAANGSGASVSQLNGGGPVAPPTRVAPVQNGDPTVTGNNQLNTQILTGQNSFYDFEYFDAPLSSVGGVSYMPFYNQNDPSLGTQYKLFPTASDPSTSELCGPTSGAMIWQGVLQRMSALETNIPANSPTVNCSSCTVTGVGCSGGCWTNKYFKNVSAFQQLVENAGELMSQSTYTSPAYPSSFSNGLWMSEVNNMIPKLSSDFGTYSGGDQSSMPVAATQLSITGSLMTNGSSSPYLVGGILFNGSSGTAATGNMPAGAPVPPTKAYAVQLQIGLYFANVTTTQATATTGGITNISFTRDHSHFIVLSGVVVDDFGNYWLVVHDPWTLDQNNSPLPQTRKFYQIANFASSPSVTYSAALLDANNTGATRTYTNTATNTMLAFGYIPQISSPDMPPQNSDAYWIVEGYSRVSTPLN